MLHLQGCGAFAIHDSDTGCSASTIIGHSAGEDDQWLPTNNMDVLVQSVHLIHVSLVPGTDATESTVPEPH